MLHHMPQALIKGCHGQLSQRPFCSRQKQVHWHDLYPCLIINDQLSE